MLSVSVGAFCLDLWKPRRCFAGAVAFHAHFGLPVDKTHRINVWFRLVICHYLWDDSLIGKERMSQPIGGNKMINYNGYTIEKFARRGLYQVSDVNGNAIAMFTLVRDCKKFIDKKVGA